MKLSVQLWHKIIKSSYREQRSPGTHHRLCCVEAEVDRRHEDTAARTHNANISLCKLHKLCQSDLFKTCFLNKITHTHTHTRLTAHYPGLPGWAGTRKVKPIWILLKQETVSGSGISWAVCKSAPRSRQIATPAPHHSVFHRPDALPAAQPTAS